MIKTWNEYEKRVRAKGGQSAMDLEVINAIANIITAISEQREKLGLSQRKLAELANLPQSTIARFETSFSIPNLDTLLALMIPLGLTLEVKRLNK